MGFYDFTLKDGEGHDFATKSFEGKVVMVVNTATGCGFTPQYKEIEAMYEAFKGRGFDVLDVPCNQFGNQTPGTDEEVHQFCTLNYNTQFPQMKKSDVNGANELPLYTFLKSQQTFKGFGMSPAGIMMSGIAKKMDKDYKNNANIKWNFTKFIVDRQGNVVARFEPTEDMKKVSAFVEKLL